MAEQLTYLEWQRLTPRWQWVASTQRLRESRQQMVGYLARLSTPDGMKFLDYLDRQLWLSVPRWAVEESRAGK